MKQENKQPKLNYRYSGNTVYIDIRIDFYREIYNEWDFSPMVNRDLDDDLLEYIESSAEEIPQKYSLCIVFNIPRNLKDADKEEKSIKGFHYFFTYQIRRIKIERKKNFRSAFMYGFFGLVLIFIAYFLRQASFNIPFFDVIIEGFFIGGWVLFWELFSSIFFKHRNIIHRKNTLERLMKSTIMYRYLE
ncbi:MAG: hypothetical protein JW969_05055 [Spirochaetales bacterium]|nr:hypothetical protein [Spirochaetales bacterium]